MKKIYALSILALSAATTSFAQSTTCPWVNAGPDQTICAPNCATLTATYLQANSTTNYTISTPPYSPDPFNAGTSLVLGDDQWSGVINLPFPFSFMGNCYTQCLIGSNGMIGFDLTPALGYCQWPISAAVPSVSDPMNTIMGPWQDLWPPVAGQIYYQTYGTAPCRRFVVSWNACAMYSCGTLDWQQLVLYETTNIIDNFIQTKPLCASWNAGAAIQALHNATGTVAYVVPGRNYPTQWTATNDARRYTPSGLPLTSSFSWLNSSNVVIGTTPTIVVCPTTTSTYTAQVVYTNCNGTTVVVTDPITVNVSTLNVTMTPSSASICAGQSVGLSANAVGAISYVWTPATGLSCTTCSNPTASPTTTTTYTCTVSNGTCTGTGTVTVTVNPLPTVTVNPNPTSYCSGGSVVLTASGANTYAWAPATGLSCTTCANPTASPTVTTTYTVTGTSAAGCTATTTVTVTVLPRPTVTINPNPTSICSGQNVVLTASGANTYNWAPATGLSCTTCANPTASPTATTTYTVTGTAVNGCTNTATVTVTVNPTPTITVNPSAPSYCAGGSVVLVASGATSYVWSPATGLSCTSCVSPTANPTVTTTYTVTGTSGAGCTGTTTVTVTVLPRPTITINPNPATICNGGSVVLTASGASTYAWAPATGLSCTTCANPTANPTATTTYTVTGTAVNGCTNTATVTVTVNPVPTVTINPNPVSYCAGGSAVITASGATTYAWAPATGLSCTTCANPTANPTATTTYTVTGTNASGCTNTATVTVTVLPNPTISIVPAAPSICVGASVNLTASGASTYVWTPATGLSCTTCPNPTANPTVTTTYTVVGTAVNGCTAQSTVTVTVNPLPTITVNPPAPAICPGGNINLTASGATTYAWSPATGLSATTGATVNASPTATTTYTVTGTSAAGCTNTTTVTVTVNAALIVTINPNPVSICNGQNVVLTANNAVSYVWTPATGLSCTTCASPTASPTVTTTYTVTGTNASGCTGTATVVVTVNPNPTVTVTPAAPAICAGSNVVLTANGATTYAWSPATGLSATTGSVVTATPTATTTYTVVGTSAAGCTNQTTVTVTVNPLPTITINPAAPAICPGGNINLTASGANTYAWSPATGLSATTGATVNASPTATTTYTVIGTTAAGCTSQTTVTVTVNAALIVTINPNPTAICRGSSVALTANNAVTYVWTPSATLSASTGATVTANPTVTTTYTVTGTNASGCTGTATVTVTVNVSATLTIASTPALCNGASNGTATVTPSGGNAPYTYVWTPTGQTTQTATGLSAGTYTVVVTTANGCTSQITVVVTQPTAVTATTSSVNSNCGTPSGSATVNPSGGTGPYTYNWNPSGQTTQTATGLLAGSYTCTVTDANGCTYQAIVNVNNNAAGTASISASTNVLCFGGNNGSATVTMTGGQAPFTYVWTPSGGTGATGTGLTAGNYTVTVTDANGCTTSATVTITQPTQLTNTSAQTNATCNGTCNGTATVTASGGTTPYTYAWAPSGGTAATATGLCAGNYTCTITDANGCTRTQTFTITQPLALTAITAQNNVTCNAACNGAATVVISGGTPPYTYNWTPSGGTNATASNLCAGTYTCTTTDANGCTRTNSFTITQPTALSLATSFVQSTCGNPNGSASVVASGATPGYTYNWSPSAQTNATATGLSAGSYTVTVTDANGCTATATVNVPNAGSPTASISASVNVSCNGGSNGTATASATGGTAPYTYAWNPTAQTTATATGLSAGSYTVTITDANGCSSTATVTITQPTQVVVVISGSTNVSCFGGSNGTATASGSGGTGVITYAWNPSGQTTATATGLVAGTYTVTATDANGCTATTTIVITQPTLLTVTTTQVNVLCNGNNTGSATGNASGGTLNYSYAWTPTAQTTQTATGLTAGNYTVVVTDANGCTVQATVTITQPPALTLATSFVQSTCSQPNGSATVVANGGNPAYSYLWSNGQTTSTATGLMANTYTITVTDANGCTASATVTVPNAASPLASISATTNVSCFNGNNGTATVTVNGGTAPYTYVWNPTAQTTTTATGLAAGNYTVTVTDANGCTSTAIATITQPTLLTATISASTNVLCNGGNNGSATVTGSGGTTPYTYLWNNAQTNATATSLAAGNYTVTITDGNGCTATATVTITEPTLLTISATGHDATCNGACNGSATSIAGGGVTPYTYLWTPGNATTQNISNLCPGTYTVQVTDANGCAATDTAIVSQPTLIVLVTSFNTAHCNQADGDATVTPSGGVPGYTYLWNNGQTTATATGLAPNTYTVTVTDANGCTMQATVTVPNTPGVVANITSSNNVTCHSACNGDATAQGVGGNTPYTYSWTTTPSQNTPTATGLCAGPYTCYITDANGCVDTANVIITEPPILSINPITAVTICNGQSTTLTVTATGGTPNYNFVWNPGNSSGSSVTVSPNTTTTYTVDITDANGCTSAPATVTVTVNPPLAVFANGTTAICIGSSTVITANASGGNGGPYTYVWMPGNMTTSAATVSPTTTTVYTVTVNDGCTTTPASQTVTVTVNPLPVVTFSTAPTPAAGCAPLCVDFTNTTPNSTSCNWDFTVGTITNNCSPTFCFTQPGSYDVTLSVVDNNGCANSLTMPALVTVYPNPIADFTMSPQPTTVLNGTINFTDLSQLANTWSWEFGDLLNSTSSQQNPQFTYTDTGYFPVILWVTTVNGCVDSILKYVRIDPEFTLYVPNAFTPNHNGNNDVFMPEGTMVDKDHFQMWIFDRWGNMIFYTERFDKGWDGRANDGPDIAQEDVYVWKIVTRDLSGTDRTYVGHVSLIK